MQLLEHVVKVNSRSDTFRLYPIGDVHIGAYNFAAKKFKQYVQMIKNDKNGMWIGGGDILDAVILQDQKRFDPNNLPDWMLTGSPKAVRGNIKDIMKAQIDYACDLLEPIKDKCIGLIEGNHEYSIAKYHNRDIMAELSRRLATVPLTDCAFIRFKFVRVGGSVVTTRLYIAHGNGGGRSAGSEPMHLNRLAQERDCEIVLRGHSHCFHIMPPTPRLTIPSTGPMPEHALTNDVRCGNWGCFLLSYASGESTYDSRSNYPVRPMGTIVVEIKPFCAPSSSTGLSSDKPRISMQELLM